MNYRRDIDGLRAIAVMLVILNHVGFSFFCGGYVGVDVFFVISGFLITAIIFPKIVNNDFTVSWFLSRRIKRLMPVLLFVVLITMIVFTFVLLPQDLVKFYRSVIWVILYGANFFFWREHGGYFDGGSQEAPLLHTWSLAVEEQYYLIWPVMLVIAVKFLGAKRTAYLSIVILMVSTIFSQWGTEITLGAAYYLLPTRFFELLLGSCLAIYWVKLPSFHSSIHHVLSVLGLCLIIGSSILLSEHSSFPGYNALYPTIGAALLIFSSKGFVNTLLSSKAMVFTGNISYSLYLWHWPIFVIVRYTSIEFSLPVQILSIMFTFVLAFISWKYIEQPLRHIKWSSFKKVSLNLYVIPSVVLVAIALIGVFKNGYPSRFSPEIVKMDEAINSFASKSRAACHSAFRNSAKLPDSACFFGEMSSKNDSASIFVFGDSHANHLVPFLGELAKNKRVVAQDYTLDRCIPLFGLDWGSNAFMASKCRERNELAKNHIVQNEFNYVVMAASWPHATTQRIYIDGRKSTQEETHFIFYTSLKNTIETIIQSGATPIFIEDTPTLGGKSPKCTVKKSVFNEGLDCSILRIDNPMVDKALTKIKQDYEQLVVLKVHDLYCVNGHCKMAIDGLPLYRDDDHLNELGAKYLAELYLHKNNNPFYWKNNE